MTLEKASRKLSYVFPLRLLLQNLGISPADLNKDRVTISTQYLRRLIQNSILRDPVDERAYLSENPDVKAAILAGDVSSANEHFRNSGYFEGRLLGSLPFDAKWYRAQYRDIEASFGPDQEDDMYRHYLTMGYFEGRAGTAEELRELERWHDD